MNADSIFSIWKTCGLVSNPKKKTATFTLLAEIDADVSNQVFPAGFFSLRIILTGLNWPKSKNTTWKKVAQNGGQIG